jgi:hypothetical protein
MIININDVLRTETEKFEQKYRELFKIEEWMAPYQVIPHYDHAFHSGPYIFSRPYPMELEYMKDIVAFCDKYDIDLSIGGESSWHSDTTVLRFTHIPFLQEFRTDFNDDDTWIKANAAAIGVAYRDKSIFVDGSIEEVLTWKRELAAHSQDRIIG